MRLHTIALLLAFGAALSAGAQSIDDILREIESNNLELKAAAYDASAEVADVKADNTLAGPSAEFSPFWQKDVAGMSSSELVVSQEFDFPTLYGLRRKAARSREAALADRYDAMRRDMLLDARLRCMELVRLQQLRRLIDGRSERSRRIMKYIEKKDSAGASTILEVNKMRMELMSVGADVAANQSSQQSVIESLVGLNGGKPLDCDSLDYPATGMIADFETFKAEALASDPALVAAQSEVAAAGSDLAASRSGWLPSISVGYRRNGAPGEAQHGMIVGLSFPVWSNSSRVQAARERQAAARLRAEDTGCQLEASLRQQYNEMSGLVKTMQLYDEELMSHTLAMLVKAVEAGQITVFDYFTESDKVYEKMAELIEARYRFNTVMANLTKSRL